MVSGLMSAVEPLASIAGNGILLSLDEVVGKQSAMEAGAEFLFTKQPAPLLRNIAAAVSSR